ncbi:MAG: M13 family metallopeptidase [Erysipelotrichaceae bacterium]|nr:M13 family metallopeptidase [Erysipelotrichaceae bacterium]
MEKVRIQDDLYQAVNGQWLQQAVIPDDRPTTGGFSLLDQNVEKTLMDDFDSFAKGTKTTDVETMDQAIKLYKKIIDTERRNEEAIQPALEVLNQLSLIDSPEEFNQKAKELLLNKVVMPLTFSVETDMKDANKNSLMIYGPSTILPDTTYYDQFKEAGDKLLKVYSDMVEKLLAFTPLTIEQQQQYLKDTLEYDSLLAKKVKSQLEWADYVNNYNPFNLSEVCQYVKPLDLEGLLRSIYNDKIPDVVVLADVKAVKEMNFYFNEENFVKFIHWSYVKTLVSYSPMLSTEMAHIANSYRLALLGVKQDPTIEKQAYQVVSRTFAEPIGVYYGRTYFGEEAKKDITNIVKTIIETWKSRVARNTFLQPSTKEKAIKKLSTIKTKLAYPDKVRDIFKKFIVEDNDSYFTVMNKIYKVVISDELEKVNKPVDKDEWLMPAHMVNACYDPNRNDITFPAAILQAPFYSINQTISENLGGIGAVISHEISHAFDNNGAHFDENGNINDWWSQQDYDNFKKQTQRMIEQWDKIEYAGGKVNGELVVSENIADNGGMAVTIEIMHNTKDSDFKQYFTNWAKIWCMKATEQYLQYLLVNDVHSPAKLRANIQVRNFEEWYQAFDVNQNDQMYLPEDKRIIIW